MNKQRLLMLALLVCAMLTGIPVSAQTDEPASCPPGSHLFIHKLLATAPVCIPDNAKKIVALDNAAVELLLFTDKEIVGTFDLLKDEMSASLPPLTSSLARIQGIGWPANLELILSLKPDLVAVRGERRSRPLRAVL